MPDATGVKTQDERLDELEAVWTKWAVPVMELLERVAAIEVALEKGAKGKATK